MISLTSRKKAEATSGGSAATQGRKASGPGNREIARMLATDPEAGMRAMVGAYGEAIYWHLRHILVNHDDTEDAAQNTFIKVFNSRMEIRNPESLKVWLYRIATNEAIQLIRQRHPADVSLDTEDALPTLAELKAEAYVDYTDLEAVRLQEAIGQLPPKQRLTFTLRYYDELSYEEIAEVTGSTVGNAKVNYHIAKTKIKEYFKNNN